MKFIISLLLTALFAYALGLYLDWWSIAIAAFIVAVCIPQIPWKAFLSGGLGTALLWGTYSLFLNGRNDGLLARKIAAVLPLAGSVIFLVLLTAFISGAVGGLAALTGSFLRRAPIRKTSEARKAEVITSKTEPAI